MRTLPSRAGGNAAMRQASRDRTSACALPLKRSMRDICSIIWNPAVLAQKKSSFLRRAALMRILPSRAGGNAAVRQAARDRASACALLLKRSMPDICSIIWNPAVLAQKNRRGMVGMSLRGRGRGIGGSLAKEAQRRRRIARWKAAACDAAVALDEGRKKSPRGHTARACFSGGPSGTRTPNQLIKSQLLYQLS